MRVPISWLRDFVETDATPQAFADALTARGFTVDGIVPQSMPDHIVVGRVETLTRHPNADRLFVGSVDVGSQHLQIVTGAANVKAGDKVPIALVGATVYARAAKDGSPSAGSTRIERSTLRGVESNGMMCSPDELALPGEYEDGILIMEEDAPVGEDFWRATRFGDAVLEVDVPSNRPDGLAIVGLAREAAAGLRAPLRLPELEPYAGDTATPIAVEIGDASLCRRLVGQYFWNAKQRRTPLWMQLRLQAAGVRSINWFVDVSNYVQLEIGQPLHFYDADKIRGGRIVARSSAPGESVTTLDGVPRALAPGTPVIADESGPIGIAGIMGGADSGVTENTRNIFMESPNFVGARIRRASLALGLRTEGALRHEKDLPLELPEIGRRLAAKFLLESGGTPSAVVETGAKPGPPRTVSARPERVNAVLGSSFSVTQMKDAMTAIDIKVRGESPLEATVPHWRQDITQEVDLIEEVARGIGYGDIPEVRAVAAPQSIHEGQYAQETFLARQFAAAGYREIVSIALQGTRMASAWERSGLPFWQHVVPITNPLSDDFRFLRPSLLPGLLTAAAKAWPSGNALRLFEIGHTFRPLDGSAPPALSAADAAKRGVYTENGVSEWPSLGGIAIFDDAQVAHPLDTRLLEVKGEIEAIARRLLTASLATDPHERPYFHPGASGNIVSADRVIAKFGRVHPQLTRAFDLPQSSYAFFLYLENIPQYPPVRVYEPVAKFPGTQRDIAVVVDEQVSAGELSAAALAIDAPFLLTIVAFDEYRGRQVGQGKKSIALTATFRRADATITDEEANVSIEVIVNALKQKFGAQLRT